MFYLYALHHHKVLANDSQVEFYFKTLSDTGTSSFSHVLPSNSQKVNGYSTCHETRCVSLPPLPSSPRKNPNLKKESFVFACVGNSKGNKSLYSICTADQCWSMNGRQAAFMILCSPRLWIYNKTASIFKRGLGGNCALFCVTLSHVIITLRVLYLIKKGCVLCWCWQELCRKCCVHAVKRECSASFHLQNELP